MAQHVLCHPFSGEGEVLRNVRGGHAEQPVDGRPPLAAGLGNEGGSSPLPLGLRSAPRQLDLHGRMPQDNANGGGTVILGVVWYDEEFFTDRRDAWLGVMHQRIYKDLGIPLENIEVSHRRLIA